MTLPSSYRRANNAEDGPFRAVERTEWIKSTRPAHGRFAAFDSWAETEVLACGHRGNVLNRVHDDPTGLTEEQIDELCRPWRQQPRKKRRCYSCAIDANRAASCR